MQLTQGLRRSAQLFPKRTSTVFGPRRRTWSETLDRVERLAGGLTALGANPGDRIALLGLNSDRYIEATYAIMWAGCIVVPGNTPGRQRNTRTRWEIVVRSCCLLTRILPSWRGICPASIRSGQSIWATTRQAT